MLFGTRLDLMDMQLHEDSLFRVVPVAREEFNVIWDKRNWALFSVLGISKHQKGFMTVE
jgi:hypothetical protein